MANENDDFLSMKAIAALARERLPQHYQLVGVRFGDSSSASGLSGALVITIEFRNLLDRALYGTSEDVRAHQKWANPLIAKIRTQWPRDEITVAFYEREASET